MKKSCNFLLNYKMSKSGSDSTINAEIFEVGGIQFGILSAEEIIRMSVCVVNSPKLSGPGSVYDERMGYMANGDSDKPCVTCGHKTKCIGHFGRIEFSQPVLHPLLYKEIALFLKCFCKTCCQLILSEEQLAFLRLPKKPEQRFKKILAKVIKTETCFHCNNPQPKISYNQADQTINMEYKGSKPKGAPKGANAKISVALSVDEISRIFNGVSDDDMRNLGFDPQYMHVRNLILTVLPVIPPCSRPYVLADGKICDDDLTSQYNEIVKYVERIRTEETPDPRKPNPLQTLIFRISTLMNNSKGKAKHPTDGRPFKGIKERISGKEGRIRGSLMGKRSNFSARTVITSGAHLRMRQLGVPATIAATHTKPEIVTKYNIEWLKQLIEENKVNTILGLRCRVDEKGREVGKPELKRIVLKYALYKKGTDLEEDDIIARPGVVINSKGVTVDDPIIPTKSNGDIKLSKLEKDYRLIVVTDSNIADTQLQKGDILIRNKKQIPCILPTKKNLELRYGDVVERQLQDGDLVLFNRQPTLHKGSMQAMEVKIVSGSTFQFQLSDTATFNSDFDNADFV